MTPLSEFVKTAAGAQMVVDATASQISADVPVPKIVRDVDQYAARSAEAAIIASVELKKQLGADSGRGFRLKCSP